jgi:hypothetical protein
MANFKFKIGDRVRVAYVNGGDDAKEGQIGTVIDKSHAPWVVFDEPTGFGHEPDDFDSVGWKKDHMDCMVEDQLELLEGSVDG